VEGGRARGWEGERKERMELERVRMMVGLQLGEKQVVLMVSQTF
jgi:hypothetical protein